ncbi:MAG TPA: protein kinase [Kofleriaceae bacterium]|nr:protein kinase [Kofleriaceae bacterium]
MSSEENTVVATPTVDESAGPADDAEPRADRPLLAERYRLARLIGKGGMGEVIAARDEQVGRDVAIKRMRASAPSERAIKRFLREASIQGRLEHPAIVPVHEIGHDSEGLPFFVMKKLTGITLGKILVTAERREAFGLQRILRAFVDVCLAMELAHVRGVVHRDLKPDNILLGDYGEVYILDWGVAKIIGEDDDGEFADVGSGSGEHATVAGTTIGTPGYMPPEQACGSRNIDGRTDIYALGCVLFEILSGEPLHPRGTEGMHSALSGGESRPSRRAPGREIAPELDALCVAALAKDPKLRPTARRLADKIEDFLDGDRDVARRKAMSHDLAWIARAAFDDGNRSDAMRAAGRALALDPEATGAAELVTRLMLEPPREIPAGLAGELRKADADAVVHRARLAVFAYCGLASFLPIAIWNGIRKWDAVLAVVGWSLVLAAWAYVFKRRPHRGFAALLAYAIANAILLGLMSRMAGSFTFVPALACYMVMSTMSYPPFVQRPWPLVAAIVLGLLAPLALEQLAWIQRTWDLRDGGLFSHSGALALDHTGSVVMLVTASVITVIVASIQSSTVARANRNLQRQLVTQAWHLRQLLPTTTG